MQTETIVVDTPQGIEFFRLLSIRGRLKLMSKGIKFKELPGRSTLKVAQSDYGVLSGRYAAAAVELDALVQKCQENPDAIWETPRGRRVRPESDTLTLPGPDDRSK